MSAWQPIETAPKVEGVDILSWDGWSVQVVWWERYRKDGEWFYDADNYTWPTHWMPLPEPP